jgi:hypothetical protein
MAEYGYSTSVIGNIKDSIVLILGLMQDVAKNLIFV